MRAVVISRSERRSDLLVSDSERAVVPRGTPSTIRTDLFVLVVEQGGDSLAGALESVGIRSRHFSVESLRTPSARHHVRRWIASGRVWCVVFSPQHRSASHQAPKELASRTRRDWAWLQRECDSAGVTWAMCYAGPSGPNRSVSACAAFFRAHVCPGQLRLCPPIAVAVQLRATTPSASRVRGRRLRSFASGIRWRRVSLPVVRVHRRRLAQRVPSRRTTSA